MSRQFWSETLSWATADGTAIANTTTETVIFPNVTIPGNFMQDGRVLRLVLGGRYSTTGTPTLTFRVRWGGTSGTQLCASGAMVTGSAVTNAQWRMEVMLQVRANGSSGSIFALGGATLGSATTSSVGSATNAGAFDHMGSAGVATPAAVTVDLTADTALSVTAQWGTASASNTLTGHIYVIEAMN
jgi:hypothetical protein